MNENARKPEVHALDSPDSEALESRLWTPSRRVFLGTASSTTVAAGLLGALSSSEAAGAPKRAGNLFAGLSKREARIARAAGEEVFEEMRAEAIESLGPMQRTRSEFQKAVQLMVPAKKRRATRGKLRTQLQRGDKKLGRYRKQLAKGGSRDIVQVIHARRKQEASLFKKEDIDSLRKATPPSQAAGSFKTLYLKLLKFKLTKTYELGKNEIYVGGVKTTFSGSASKIGVMKLGDIKKKKTKSFSPHKTIATVPFSSWKMPSSCFCSLVFSEHDPFSQKHEKIINKALVAIKKFLAEQLAYYKAALQNVISEFIKIKILAKLMAAIAGYALKFALNKFFDWALGLVGDEVAKPLLLVFKAPSKKPWGSGNKGGVHTSYVSGKGIGGYATYQWSAK